MHPAVYKHPRKPIEVVKETTFATITAGATAQVLLAAKTGEEILVFAMNISTEAATSVTPGRTADAGTSQTPVFIETHAGDTGGARWGDQDAQTPIFKVPAGQGLSFANTAGGDAEVHVVYVYAKP
jgi:hypothetical protein